MDRKLTSRAILNSIATVCYVGLVVLFMSNGEKIFGNRGNFIVLFAMLLLFILSASITGGLVLGKPILLYLDNKKREAVTLFIYTLVCLAIILVGVFIVAAVF